MYLKDSRETIRIRILKCKFYHYLTNFFFLQYCKSILYPLWKRHHLHGRGAGSEGSRGTRKSQQLHYGWNTGGGQEDGPVLSLPKHSLTQTHRNIQNTSLNILLASI